MNSHTNRISLILTLTTLTLFQGVYGDPSAKNPLYEEGQEFATELVSSLNNNTELGGDFGTFQSLITSIKTEDASSDVFKKSVSDFLAFAQGAKTIFLTYKPGNKKFPFHDVIVQISLEAIELAENCKDFKTYPEELNELMTLRVEEFNNQV